MKIATVKGLQLQFDVLNGDREEVIRGVEFVNQILNRYGGDECPILLGAWNILNDDIEITVPEDEMEELEEID